MEKEPSDDSGERGERRRGQRFVFGAFLFNVDRALDAVAEASREPARVEVAPWASFFGFDITEEHGIALFAPRHLDRGYAMTTDLDEPVLIATLEGNEGRRFPLLIDGTHRIYKAHALGVDTLPAYVLDERESLAIRDDPFVGSPTHWQNHDRSRDPGSNEPPRGGTP